ncbi:MAG: sensor histidine kinase [Thermoanaerobaculia bacterium]
MKLLHPLLATPGRVLAFLASTLVLGAALAGLLVRWSGLAAGTAAVLGLPLGVLLGFGALTTWYAVRAVPRPAGEPSRAVLVLGSAIGAGTAVWLLLGGLWARVLESFAVPGEPLAALRAAWPPLLVVGLLAYGFAVLLHYLLVALERSQEAERRSLEAATLAREAELAALRAQLAPHFLFNSLNSIAALAGSEPAAARRMCTLLADFFRRSLTAGARERIPLADELELARTYLEVEQVRFGDRLRVAWEIEDGVGSTPVPPLLLQPLVENAVHHGVAHRVDGGTVSIRAERRSGAVRMEIANPVDPDRPMTRGTGTGLQNLRQRLRSLAGGREVLTVEESPELFRVTIVLPADESARQ